MTDFNKSAADILAARMAEIAEKSNDKAASIEAEPQTKSHLSPVRHNQQDFFVVDIFDAIALKGDLASLEHPLFALKAGDTRDRHYAYKGITVDIKPTSAGIATIHDKDVWIYCVSSLVSAKNRGEKISRKVHFTAYDFLVSTNRETGGRNYKLLKETFDRLAGTRIITNIATGEVQERRNFGLLDEVRILYKDERDEASPMIAVEVTLPDWLFRSIESGAIKTISPDYFRIRKPLDRRIYELCAKHCGNQQKWLVSLTVLHQKSGSTANIREFRRAVKSLADSHQLPDYSLTYDSKKDMVQIVNKTAMLKKIRSKNGDCIHQ